MSLLSPALAGRFFTTSTTWEAPMEQYQELIQVLSDAHFADEKTEAQRG